MISYLTDRNKTTSEGIFGIGCNPLYAALEMEFVQRNFFYDHLTHPYLQVIFAFDVGVDLPIKRLRKISINIGHSLLSDRRQLFGAIHFIDKPNKIHCHYIMNYVSTNGSLYRQCYSLWHYKHSINEILNYYDLSLIKIYNGDEKKFLSPL